MRKTFSKFKDRNFLKRFSIVLIIVLLIIGFFVYEKIVDRISIEDSLVQAPIITISPSGTGKVQEIDVTEGQEVQKGQTLAVVGSETIRAYSNGLIIYAPNIVGSSASPQTQLIEMIQPTDLRIAGTIDENKGLDEIKVGQVVSFTVDALPGKTYWGYVDEVSPTAKTAQLSFSISSERPTQQFVVYARFNSAEYPEIKNGMSAKMTVFTRMP